nr:hypothetical protein [Allomuricauda sp.]
MGTSELLRYLEKLEIGLSSFSYEELNTHDAGELKKSFDEFKNGLEDKVFGIPPMHELDVVFEEVGIRGSLKSDSSLPDSLSEINSIASLLAQLEEMTLNKTQQNLLGKLKHHVQVLGKLNGFQNLFNDSNNLEASLEVQRKSKVDLGPLWEECMFQMDLLEELVRLYKQNVLEFVGKIRLNLQSKNFREIGFSCQKVGSSLRMLRTLSLLEITEQMSLVCKTDNDLKHVKFLYGQFLVEFPKVEELLDIELEMLRQRNKE